MKFNFCNEGWKIILSYQWEKLPHPPHPHPRFLSEQNNLLNYLLKYCTLFWQWYGFIPWWEIEHVWLGIQRNMFTSELSSKVFTPPSVMPNTDHLLSVSSNTQYCLDGLKLCWHQDRVSNIVQLLPWKHGQMYTVPKHGTNTK